MLGTASRDSRAAVLFAKVELPLWLKIGVSIVIFCLSVSAVPIYNKLVFSGTAGGVASGLGLKKYPYPIATAFLQLGFVAVVLAVGNVALHNCSRREGQSWLFGPHFCYKLRHVAPVGLLFGLKYGITNWGLQLVPLGTHLLLQSSDLIWTVAIARVLNKEKLGALQYVAAALSTVGSLMIAANAVKTLDAPFFPLLVNLLTPLVLALTVSFLRAGAKELFHPNNRLQGSMTSVEFTALKLFFSSAFALLLSMFIEGMYSPAHKEAWFVALGRQPLEGVAAILFGGVFVLIFQVNLTWLASITSAVTVGIVGGIKVAPQWLLSAAFALKVNLTWLNLGGAAVVLVASTLYAAAPYLDQQQPSDSSDLKSPLSSAGQSSTSGTAVGSDDVADPAVSRV